MGSPLSQYRPVLKWAGGKRQLLSALENHVPKRFNRYYEPFVGAGALLLHLYSSELISKAVISDMNADLIALYSIIKEDPYSLIKALQSLPFHNTREDYYRARDLFNGTTDKLQRAALLIYLNRHGFNGLYRVNSRNEFNVPFGRYRNPTLPSREIILAFHRVLKSCTIYLKDFEETVRSAKEGDFVYLDPPYMPVSKTSSFTSYTSGAFSRKEQMRLFKVFRDLSNRGVYVVESNSDSEFIRELYSEFKVGEFKVRRNINSDAGRRSGREVIIIGYESD